MAGKEIVVQQVRIDIEVEDEAEAAAVEAESVPEPIYLLSDINAIIIELTTDEEDTDKQIDSTVGDHWEDIDVEAV